LQAENFSAYNAGSLDVGRWSGAKRNAGVAQLVERNLAKVEVESSRLFSRSKLEKGSPVLPFFLSGNLCLEFAAHASNKQQIVAR
jgi:hypothetical protein